jgi:hypothetical protein
MRSPLAIVVVVRCRLPQFCFEISPSCDFVLRYRLRAILF